MYIQDRIDKFAVRNVLTNKLHRVKTVARLLVGGMKCHGIKCPGLTVAGRSVAIPSYRSKYSCFVFNRKFS